MYIPTLNNIIVLRKCHYLANTIKPVNKGHSGVPENVVFMSSCPLYTG